MGAAESLQAKLDAGYIVIRDGGTGKSNLWMPNSSDRDQAGPLSGIDDLPFPLHRRQFVHGNMAVDNVFG